VTTAEILELEERRDRSRAVENLRRGEVIASAFNGIFVLLGDADEPAVPGKVAAAKGRSQAKGLALVCPPEFLDEHVDLESRVLDELYPLECVQALQRRLHALGVILPAALEAPAHIVQGGTVLNVWTEQSPKSPLRELVRELRRHGRRALAGTSANLAGRPTITEVDEVVAVFAQRVSVILVDDFKDVPPRRRHSATIVELTGPKPRLFREGSVAAAELAEELRCLRLGELVVSDDIRRV
jgi:L-threonylcarbamoyladenylate synthase